MATPIVGREPELSALDAFLASDARPRALLLTGGPGIGKTTLWDAAVEAGRQRGLRVLAARASDADTKLSFAALIDLLDGVGDEELATLPPPRRLALEVALLRAEPTGGPPEPHAIALGLLDALRSLAQRGPLLVAVDDVQWLDRASEDALAFAVRRLADEPAAFLLARRPGPRSELERALEAKALERVEVRSPSLGAIRSILSERLGLTLPRHVLRRLYDAALGNPLFVLELGRKVRDDGVPTIGEDLPVPDDVEELLGTRVAGLPEAVRHVLLAVALSPSLRVGQLASLAEPEALELAVDAGVLVLDGDHVRASHPLLAAAAVRRSQAGERRELHRDLAGVVPEAELRTRHLALAAAQPDAELAAGVAAAAASAARRGAPQAAVELAEHALRLTPHDHSERDSRMLELAGYLVVAGEKRRLTGLLEPHVHSLPAGARRAQGFLLLTSGEIRDNDDIQRYLELALAESGDDARARASVLADMAENVAAVRVERIAEAEAWALEALAATRGGDPELERRALYALAWTGALGGRAIDDVWERFRAASPEPFYIAHSPERIAGQRLVWRGEIGAARAILSRQLVEADERGEPSSYALQRLHLCELELRAGEWTLPSAGSTNGPRRRPRVPALADVRAVPRAPRRRGGPHDEARRWGTEADARASASGVRWDQLEAQRALGTAQLLAHDTAAAADRLRRRGTTRSGQACAIRARSGRSRARRGPRRAGQLDEAGASPPRRGAAEQQDHPWAGATARRARRRRRSRSCTATRRDHPERAADEYARLGLGFDSARSLFVLGRAQRRHRKWAPPRDARAGGAAFDELGRRAGPRQRAPSSAASARVDRHRPELTPTERRVAELGSRTGQQADRAGARRQRQHRRIPPLEHLRQARVRSRTARGTTGRAGRAFALGPEYGCHGARDTDADTGVVATKDPRSCTISPAPTRPYRRAHEADPEIEAAHEAIHRHRPPGPSDLVVLAVALPRQHTRTGAPPCRARSPSETGTRRSSSDTGRRPVTMYPATLSGYRCGSSAAQTCTTTAATCWRTTSAGRAGNQDGSKVTARSTATARSPSTRPRSRGCASGHVRDRRRRRRPAARDDVHPAHPDHRRAGAAPETCNARTVGSVAEIPYTADYAFWKSTGN